MSGALNDKKKRGSIQEMANTTIAAPSGSARHTEGTALQRFLQATEIDTRLLGMIAALQINRIRNQI